MEEPSQGVGAPAQPPPAPQLKQESPALPKDFELSPQATKRPLEPAPEQENGDPKRLKLGEDPMSDAIEMELDLEAMVQDVLGDIDNQMSRFGSMDGTSGGDMNLDMGPVDPPPRDTTEPTITFLDSPIQAVRAASLPALSHFALQIIIIVSQQHSPNSLSSAIRTHDSEAATSWVALKNLFTSTRQLFSQTDPVLHSDFLGSICSTDELRLANLASICCSLTSTGRDADTIDRRELYKSFFSILLRDGSELSNVVSDLFVAAKTQAIIDSVAKGVQETPIDQIIEEAFPASLEQNLKSRHGGSDLTQVEQALVTLAYGRKEALFKQIAEGLDEGNLRSTYENEELFRLLGSYLSDELQHFAHIATKYNVQLPMREPIHLDIPDDVSEMDEQALSSLLEATDGLVAQYLPNGGIEVANEPAVPTTEGSIPPAEPQTNGGETTTVTAPPAQNGTTDHSHETHDLFAEIEHQTQEYVRTTLSNLSPAPYQPTVPAPTGSTMAQTPYLSHLHQTQNHPPPPTHYYGYPPLDPNQTMETEESGPLPPSQSLPSAMLYDRARQAALSKNTNPQRREGGSSTRRPWSQEEEKALMTGLDKVQGPHWSQILSLYGAGGSISNILKDRSQVQLKDKARNLKLFFLKSNSEMPYYLQAVTGELKTRAPGQAARKEAEEKARQTSEEAQVRGQGNIPIASNIQSSPHSHQKTNSVTHHGFHSLNHAVQAPASPYTPVAPLATSAQTHASSPITNALPAPAMQSPVKPETQTAYTPPVTISTPQPTHPQLPSQPYTPTLPQAPSQNSAPYTPTHSYTPPQPAPTDSPHVKSEPLPQYDYMAQPQQQQQQQQPQPLQQSPQQQQPQQQQQQPQQPQYQQQPSQEPQMPVTAVDQLPAAAMYSGLDDNDDLKDAALMQSLRELEAYSGTSVS
ncbi:hypothetical protein VD0002_g9365 [Verticillium dahliae]|uniref:HTH myb-type domain-containing protein n=2 Tax=Verticillium dahliae TaxID=27337 RepID=G2WWM8_VERDV|nr:uncharacterized protein VDAG_02014 [Verticillium dahliae VdLs.17]EGY19998.1 hypothetical protein VDAG_02014 [Verticillium dahliae VdLs.17]KAF3350025.1 Protein scd2/ral3 [Verticillium dahliae VDG2]PNH49150.1 hypothetical protein VD0003_g7986 [Verticillium dahliae]PNH58159.1 hypothetical protein VD0002_g9365 [Verticillium dahliae]